MSPDAVALLRLLVEHYAASVLGSPDDVARDVHQVAEDAGCDWRKAGLPATGGGLTDWLVRHRDELAAAGLLLCVTQFPGWEQEPKWVAISSATADLTERDRHEPLELPSPLGPKVVAVCRSLLGEAGEWSGSAAAVQQAYKRLPPRAREELTDAGPAWQASADAVAQAVVRSAAALAEAGMWAETDGITVTVKRTTATDVEAAAA